jgi:methyl-accepting chemotaxis protein
MLTTNNVKNRFKIVSLFLGKRKFLINKNFQIQFIASLLLISLISMSIIFLANDYFFQAYMQKGLYLNLSPDHPYFLMIHEQKQFMVKVFFAEACLISSITIIWGLFYSHKIAGPLHRLHRYFIDSAVLSSKLNNKIYFRNNDFFQEIPDSINFYIDSLNDKNQNIDEETDMAS